MATVTDQVKKPNRAAEYTKLSPTVRSMALAPCTPHLWTYCMLELIVTVPVTNKVDIN